LDLQIPTRTPPRSTAATAMTTPQAAGEAGELVPYTMDSGRGDRASCRKPSEKKLLGRSRTDGEDAFPETIQPPPLWPERRERRCSSTGKSGRHHREVKDHATACLTPTPPRLAERSSTTSEPLCRRPPPRHHGRPGGKGSRVASRAQSNDEDKALIEGARPPPANRQASKRKQGDG
jgi:hypothetical protein